MSAEINTHNLVCDFGKHKGELWTRIPVSYLKWLVNSPMLSGRDDQARAIAAAELKRRGTVTPTIEVSGHAIDSASLRCRKTWHETAKDPHEGLHAWLCRMATEALATQPPDHYAEAVEGVIPYAGIKWVFVFGEAYPTLKTVMPV
jgi:hypothetical protein